MYFCSYGNRVSHISIFFVFFIGQISFCAGQGQAQGQGQGKPIGLAAAVTGGGNARPAAPPDIKTLKAWLADSTPRVILIDKVFDFTDTEGNTTGPGCTVWPECKNGNKVQVAIDYRGWCGTQKGAKRTTVNYRKAAITPLVIASNKSLRGVGKKGIIRGKGLVINRPSKNIIIQNIEITFLNPQAVWGGDALTFNGASDTWVDHCTFSLIGRQMISSGGSFANAGITISNNLFMGKTPWAFDCRGQHYWTILFGGIGDQVTLANNCFQGISGRAPKLGAAPNTKVTVHSFNNYYTATRGQTMESGPGGLLLAEGNVFDDVGPADPKQAVAESGGALFASTNPADGRACQSALGRACAANLISRPPAGMAPMKFALNNAVLNGVRSIAGFKNVQIQPTNTILSRKMESCGTGKM